MTPAAQIELLFSGFCAVSGSPVYPSDYKRYRLRLKARRDRRRRGGIHVLLLLAVRLRHVGLHQGRHAHVTTADGPKVYRFAVIGDPCRNEEQLDVPFVQPFDGRTTTLRRDAPEVRCENGQLIGATRTDHGFVAISMFFDAPSEEEADRGVWQPGRITRSGGHVFQDDVEYSDMCRTCIERVQQWHGRDLPPRRSDHSRRSARRTPSARCCE